MNHVSAQVGADPVSSLDPVALMRSRGIPLVRSRETSWLGPCPFHPGREQTFTVDQCGGRYKCSVCGSTGGLVDFVSRFDGLSRRHALELLHENGAAVFRTDLDTPLKHATVPRLENPLADLGEGQMETAADALLLARVAEYYRKRLQNNPQALRFVEYFGPRGTEAAAHFGIGFADRTLGLRLPQANRREGRLLRTRLQHIGILRPNGREHFRGCVLLPVFDAHGGAVAMCGYRVGRMCRRAHAHAPPPSLDAFLETPDACIWNADGLDSREVILTDTPFAALAFWSHDLRNVTFTPGSAGHRQALFTAIVQRNITRVRLAYAATVEGEVSVEKDASLLAAGGIEVMRVRFPWGLDARSFVTRRAGAGDGLRNLVRGAQWFGRPRHVMGARGSENQGGTTDADSSAAEDASSCRMAATEPLAEVVFDQNRLTMRFANREYRVHELARNPPGGAMRCILMFVAQPGVISSGEKALHVDRLDLVRDVSRRRFAAHAAQESGLPVELIRRDLGRLLLAIEERQWPRPADEATPSAHSRGVQNQENKAILPVLLPRTRLVHDAIVVIARQNVPFTRRDLRNKLGLGATQTRIHLVRLVAAGFLVPDRVCGKTEFHYTIHPATQNTPQHSSPVGGVGALSGVPTRT